MAIQKVKIRSNNGKNVSYYVNFLIFKYFIDSNLKYEDNTKFYKKIKHIDGNKLNNHYTNLILE